VIQVTVGGDSVGRRAQASLQFSAPAVNLLGRLQSIAQSTAGYLSQICWKFCCIAFLSAPVCCTSVNAYNPG
jgi:hypothetical protein